MGDIILQSMINDINYSTLPYSWNSFDIESFTDTKRLWGFQQEAVKNAIKVLWKYYEDFADFQEGEDKSINQKRKEKFFDWYKNNGLKEKDVDIKLKSKNARILAEYYPVEDDSVSYMHFINRASFWMATGSGKTIVIIKLMQILRKLMDMGEIPKGDILFLTCRDDLLEQFKKTVDEVNRNSFDCYLRIRELKEYPDEKMQCSLLGSAVFYYRSDNLDDEQKDKIVDFRNYDNEGRWYIFLDEAHKGSKEDSKRQHIYSILSRNGFLFNFSATFTDVRDIVTTAYEFNLSSFIREGYGKHISVLKQEMRAFAENEDYSDDEKQKIVLKSLILLTYVKKHYEKLKDVKLYHNPMLLTLVNSVNDEDADLKMFFREIEKIGRGEVDKAVFKQAKDELYDEFKSRLEFIFEPNFHFEIDKTTLMDIVLEDILKHAYNADSPGNIEISYRPSDKKQIAFKLTTSDRHFALFKTGDMPDWLKNELDRFEVNHQFEEEGFFERINAEDSPINMLIGSRAFYEGWDSNRPNVINFINIGTSTDAQKFILQAIGRGVRIEPVKGKRKRIVNLYNNREIDESVFRQAKEVCQPLETLFIFSTNRNALVTVIKELRKENRREQEYVISLYPNSTARKNMLLVPVYFRSAENKKKFKLRKFEISREDMQLVREYLDYIGDDRILLMKYSITPKHITKLRESLANEEDYYRYTDKKVKNIDILMQRIFKYFDVTFEELKEFKQIEDEIRHYKGIKVYMDDVTNFMDLKKKIEIIKDYPEKHRRLMESYGKIPAEEFMIEQENLRNAQEYEYRNMKIKIKHILNHYYIPVILAEDEKVDYITHIIKTPSEVKFISELENYLSKNDNRFKDFDWWFFSKLDESTDEIYIPYYHPDTNNDERFKPDFIFWLKKGEDYYIVFIDPKGTKYTEYMYKVDGYKTIFEEEDGTQKEFPFGGLKVKVYVFLYTDDANKLPQEGYRKYWYDNIDRILSCIQSG